MEMPGFMRVSIAVYEFTVNSGFDVFTMPLLLLDCACGEFNFEEYFNMMSHLKRFLKDESGAAAIEYGLLSSGISVAIIPSVKEVGSRLVAVFTTLQNALG
jgi:pilus assembly protein Flp/PilA